MIQPRLLDKLSAVLPARCRLRAGRLAGTYDVHFPLRAWVDVDRPGAGLEVLAAVRPLLAACGLRPRWSGSQTKAIRLEPGRPPRERTATPMQILKRWRLVKNACGPGLSWAQRQSDLETALRTVAHSDPHGGVFSPPGYLRWLSRQLGGYGDGDDHASLVREAARWVHVPAGEAGVA